MTITEISKLENKLQNDLNKLKGLFDKKDVFSMSLNDFTLIQISSLMSEILQTINKAFSKKLSEEETYLMIYRRFVPVGYYSTAFDKADAERQDAIMRGIENKAREMAKGLQGLTYFKLNEKLDKMGF